MTITIDIFFEALNQVEASGKKFGVPPGDDGRGIGPLQIHRDNWEDAVRQIRRKGVQMDHDYKLCATWAYSRIIAYAYWDRYCPEALRTGNWEILARVHNGGPTGHQKKSTLPYWRKVQVELQRIEARAAMGLKK